MFQFTTTIINIHLPVCHQVCGRPSADLAERMVAEEKERIEKRKKELGDAGLKEKAELVEKSCEQNEVCWQKICVVAVPIL